MANISKTQRRVLHEINCELGKRGFVPFPLSNLPIKKVTDFVAIKPGSVKDFIFIQLRPKTIQLRPASSRDFQKKTILEVKTSITTYPVRRGKMISKELNDNWLNYIPAKYYDKLDEMHLLV